MKKKEPLVTEEGDALPDIDPASDVGRAIYLLEWARRRGFRVGPALQVGSLTFQVSDLRQPEAERKGAPEQDVWAAHGHEER